MRKPRSPTVRGLTFFPRRSSITAFFLLAGSRGSVSASRRSERDSTILPNRNSSSSTWSSWPSASATAKSAWAYPWITWLRVATVLVLLLALPVSVRGHPGELVDVLVDQSQVAILVERLADHATGQREGELPDLGPELLEHAVPLGPDLVLGPRHDGLRFGFCFLAHVLAHGLGRLARLLDDAVGLVASHGK